MRFYDYYNLQVEAFSDLGKLSPEELQKGQRLDANDGNNFIEVSGRVFHQALLNISNNDELRKDLGQFYKNIKNNITLYGVKDYNLMKCFLGRNNSSGFCIKDGDELVSVFSSQGSSGHAVVKEAIRQGARRLDCFATQDGEGGIKNIGLYKLYSLNGFVVDKSKNEGIVGEPYSVQNGISYYVENGKVYYDNPTVVVYMKLK